MASNAPTPLRSVDADAHADAEDDRIAAFDDAEDTERKRPARSAQGRGFRLVEAAPPVSTLLYGSAAVLLGGTVGYWLGARQSHAVTKPAKRAKHTASTIEHGIELLPVAMQLLANPFVRSMVIRLLMRRLAP